MSINTTSSAPDTFEQLADYLRTYLRSRLPGYLSFLNMLTNLTYGLDCTSLLFNSPSKLYLIILNHYGGNVLVADHAFTLLFINPIVSYIKKPELAVELLRLVKIGKDREFVELLKSALRGFQQV